MIRFNNVDKKFLQAQKEISVLKGINFDLKENGIIAIVGKSGAGKSTFLSLLAGLDKPSSGYISIDNTNISQMSEEEITQFRSKNIGIIFQNFHLIDHFTAIENIMLPLEIHKMQNAKEKVKKGIKGEVERQLAKNVAYA